MSRPFSAASKIVLAQPFDVSPADVVAIARKAGQNIDTADVLRIRWRAKQRAAAAPRVRPAGAGAPSPLLAPVPRDASKIEHLKRLIREVGCDAAVVALGDVVAETRATFDRIASEMHR
jgi:predicted GTPase